MSSQQEFHTNKSLQNDRTILSVSDLNQLARSLLEQNFSKVVVEGEISNFAMPSSGHWYLTLKDSKAQIRCAMFSSRNRSVRFQPKNGLAITAYGKLSIYGSRGVLPKTRKTLFVAAVTKSFGCALGATSVVLRCLGSVGPSVFCTMEVNGLHCRHHMSCNGWLGVLVRPAIRALRMKPRSVLLP